jgi:hypothetical protein
VLILVEMLRRLGFDADAARVKAVWSRLYDPARGHRFPPRLLSTSTRTIPQVVDEMAFQTRRNLAQRALVDVIPFSARDEQVIRRAAGALARGVIPPDVPPRFLVSACRYAIGKGVSLPALSQRVIRHLSTIASRQTASLGPAPVRAAA